MNENEEALNAELFLKALYNVIHRGDEYRIVEGVDEGSLRLSEGKTVTGISMHTENNKEQVTISGAVSDGSSFVTVLPTRESIKWFNRHFRVIKAKPQKPKPFYIGKPISEERSKEVEELLKERKALEAQKKAVSRNLINILGVLFIVAIVLCIIYKSVMMCLIIAGSFVFAWAVCGFIVWSKFDRRIKEITDLLYSTNHSTDDANSDGLI